MPQMQLPIFPAGVTEINSRVAVEAKDGQVCYVYGHLPVFQHEETDVRSFRMFTSQMIVTGSVKPKEIVETFGVPMVTVKRYMKVYRQQGAKGFYESKPRHSSASKLKSETLHVHSSCWMKEAVFRKWPKKSRCWQTRFTKPSGLDVCVGRPLKKKRIRDSRSQQQNRAQPDRQ